LSEELPSRYRSPGMITVEHEFDVPLDHERPDGRTINVFVREIADPEGQERPYLLFLQGGPGGEAARVTGPPSGWVARALQDYRVLLLDQRGTGRSTPVGALPGMSPEQQAEYLTHFRADSIVRDAEWIRKAMGVDGWSVLGQSFGGFCLTTYLSIAPEGLREAFFTGGLAPVGHDVDDVYKHTYPRVRQRTRRYYERYPEDRDRVRRIHDRLAGSDVRLPSGDRLTPERFRQLGGLLGRSDGADQLHHIVELPPDSPAFRYDVEASTHFGRNPLYAILHEACYADGGTTRWSAGRLLPDDLREPDQFTGEHIFPSVFDDEAALRPLKEAADILAGHEWGRLYDVEALRRNEVPAAAAIYWDDLYVEYELSKETGATISGLRPWVTSEYEHNGLRVDGGRILGRLIDLVRGRA